MKGSLHDGKSIGSLRQAEQVDGRSETAVRRVVGVRCHDVGPRKAFPNREDAVLAPVERLQRQQEVDLVRRRIAGVRPAHDPDLVAAKGNGLERAIQLCPGDAADAIEATAAAARRELPTGHRHETESLLADRVPTQRRFNGGQQAVARVLVQRQHLSELVEGGAGGVSQLAQRIARLA